MHDYTGPATGVYIGRLERPRKPIEEGDDDKAHVDRAEGVSKLIKFLYTSKGHEFMRGKLLKNDQGIAHSVFGLAAAGAGAEGGEQPPEEGGEEGDNAEGEGKPAKQSAGGYSADDIISQFKHLFIKEVVREPRMHFYRVPRLGSFMAVPLEYESCLSAAALDAAVADSLQLRKAREEQEKLKLEWEEDQEKIRDEKERAGEVYVPEPKEWDKLEEKPFITKKKSYVVCLDTLGQDREFTDDQRRFVLETIKNFRAIWEEKERQNLTHDRDHRLGELDFEKEWIEQTENVALAEEEEKYAEDGVNQKDNEGNGFTDEDSKELYNRLMRLTFTSSLFKERKEWKSGLLALSTTTVLKNPRIMQTIFYLLGYTRD